MGDDVDAPHEQSVELPDAARVADVVAWWRARGAPVSVSGGSTWAVRVGGRVVAVAHFPDRRGWPARVRWVLVGDQAAPVAADDEVHLDYLRAAPTRDMARLATQDPWRADLRRLADEARS